MAVLLTAIPVTHAQKTPLPEEKPNKAPALLVTPNKKPVGSDKFNMVNKKYVFNADNLQSGGTIVPPNLPIRKQKVITSQMIDGVITPASKPLVIRSGDVERIKPVKSFDDAVILKYSSNQVEDRMAGSRGKTVEIQRLPAQPHIRIRETSDRSPFKTASLQRAKKGSGNEPVIIFFKEKSSELEVGQISVIEDDVFNTLMRRKNQKVAIYGYSENGGEGKNVNQLSMSRALLVSEYLVDKGIDPDRIEARAMGGDTPISPKNRVDAVLFE